jgi:heterodisulfide reductase subunit C2
MPIRIKKEIPLQGLIHQVEERSGVTLSACLQCKRCSSGCPVSTETGSSPAEVIKALQLGAGNEILERDIVWTCLSCATCFSRCPVSIDMGAVMDALRMLAVEKGLAKPEGNMPLMNRLLLDTIRRFGRTYDLGAMAFYKAGTSTYTKDLEKFPSLLSKGKIALLPPRGADRKLVKRIFKTIAKTGER